MKKLLILFICLTTVFSLSGCYSSENKQLAKEIRKEAEQIATKYIENKYNFTPKILSVAEIKTGSEYSFMKTPTKEVQIDMSYKGHKFTTFVAGESTPMKCYDNYEQEKLTKLLDEYIRDSFPIQEKDIRITSMAGYQYGYIENMPPNLINKKVSSNLWSVISEEEDPLNVYYIIEFSSPENIAKKIQRQDFEDLYFLPDDVLGKIERRVVLINYWNKEDIGKITPEHIRFGKKQQESFYYDNTAVYAKEIKIINIDLFKDGGVQYISNPEPIKFGKYTFISNVEIEDIDTCPEKIKDIDNEHYLADNKEIVGCHYIKTQDKDNHIKVYIKKEDIGLKTERYGNNVVFVKEDSYYGISYPDGNVVGEYYYTTVKSSDSETNRFFLIENEKH